MGQDEAINHEAFPERRCRSFGERQGAGVKRMHVPSYLISCGFQRGVPRIIGRAIRGTLLFRAKLDMKITHAVHTQILCGFQSHIPQTVNRRVGKSDRDVPRKLASSIRGTRCSKLTPEGFLHRSPGSRRGHGRLGGEARSGQREAPRASRPPDRRNTRTASARTQSARSLHRRARQRGERAWRVQARALHPPWLGASRR